MKKRLLAILIAVFMLSFVLSVSIAEAADPVSGAVKPAARRVPPETLRGVSDTYTLVTDASQLSEGDEIVFVSDDGESFYIMGTSFTGVSVTLADLSTLVAPAGAQMLTLTAAENGWLLSDENGYLCANGSSLAKTAEEEDAAVWTISAAADGEATVSCEGGDILFNDSVRYFFCGDNGVPVMLYVATEEDPLPCGENLFWKYSNGTLTITGTGAMDDYLSNTQPWASVMSDITNVILPEGLTHIGDCAFYRCTGLAEIFIPEGVTSIGDNAFYNCSSLMDFSIPESVIGMGAYVFWNTGWHNAQSDGLLYKDNVLLGRKGSFTSQIVRIKAGTRVIAADAFEYCSSIMKITIPDSVIGIGKDAFYNCTSLSSVSIPDSVTDIGIRAFYGCTNLSVVTIGSGLTIIGQEVFSGCTGLTTILIPDNITTIGSSAFIGCTGLTEIVISDGVASIEQQAFQNCTNLESVTIGNGVTSIGQQAFYQDDMITSITMPCSFGWKTDHYIWGGLSNLANLHLTVGSGVWGESNSSVIPWQRVTNALTVTLDEGILNIGDYAFYRCTGLTSINIPESVTSIGSNAFSGCTGLTEITIPEGVTSIGDSAFYGCAGLTEITIPESVTSIGESAFAGCTGLTEVVIPNGVTSIEFQTFFGCTGLTEIVIPESVTSIGNYAFKNCSGLEEITIPESVTSIGESAFIGCTGLTEVTIPNGVTSIGVNTFYLCSGLTSVTIGNGVTTIGSSAFSDCTGLSELVIPDNVTTIEAYAFRGCTGLTAVTIGNGVTEIGNNAFDNCTAVTSITLPCSLENYGNAFWYNTGISEVHVTAGSEDWNLSYNRNGVVRSPLWYNSRANIQTVTLDEGIQSIGYQAFSECTALTEIVIPESVTSIGGHAFSGCTGLTSIIIPDNVTTIYYGAFQYCSGLEDVLIGSGVTSIGSSAFQNCSAMETLVIGDSVESIGSRAFDYCIALTSLTMPCSADTGSEVFRQCGAISELHLTKGTGEWGPHDSSFPQPWSASRSTLQTVILDEGILEIGKSAFQSCTAITEIVIPDSVTSIGCYAFYGCTGLTEITIPDSVTSIGGYAFYGCTGLTEITIPDSVTSVDEFVFYGCTGLTEVTIPDSVTTIGNGAFQYCTGLQSVTIPSSVTEIQDYTFYGCSSLQTVTLSNSVTSIGQYAFQNCSSLTDVYFLGTKAQKEQIVIDNYNYPLLNATWHYIPIAFKSQALTLEGRIGVNFFIDLPQDEAIEYEGVSFTIDSIDGAETFVPFTGTSHPKNSSGYYQFTYYTRTIEMANTITATLRYTLNGKAGTLEKTYSVKQYFETFDQYISLFNEKQQNMVRATADLGHYVQAFLAAQKEWTLGTQYEEMDKHYADYTAADITAAQTALALYAVNKSTGTNMQMITYSLVLDSDTELLVYFKPASGYTGTFTFTVNGTPIAENGEKISVALQSDGRYMVSIKNIAAHELGNEYVIKAMSDGDEASITVSALSYASAMITSYANNSEWANAAIAIWRYATAAEAMRH